MNNNDTKKKMCRSSPDSPDIQIDRKYITGIPFVAPYNIFTAPVHLDVGGRIYTTTLETLTAVPESRLAKMFNGELPVIIDKLKQHYFIDRDGDIFRHILNYLRYKSVILPSDFSNYELLYNEALYFKLDDMAASLIEMQSDINKECCKSLRRKRIIVELEHNSDEERDAKAKRLI